MSVWSLRTSSTGVGLLSLLLVSAQTAWPQTVTAIPKLDLKHFTGVWYEVERYPNKRQKNCVSDAFTEIALADKPNKFQLVNACRVKSGEMDANNGNGKQDKSGDGRLKISFLWPFSTQYWVMALGPNDEWALVGSPNHRNLWVFSRERILPPETLTDIEAKAVAEGFTAAKLVKTPQHQPPKP